MATITTQCPQCGSVGPAERFETPSRHSQLDCLIVFFFLGFLGLLLVGSTRVVVRCGGCGYERRARLHEGSFGYRVVVGVALLVVLTLMAFLVTQFFLRPEADFADTV